MQKHSIDEVKKGLSIAVHDAYHFLSHIGYDEVPELIELVDVDEYDPDTKYKVKAMDKILQDICEAKASLEYLKRRETMEVHTLTKVGRDRYGYYDKHGMAVEFHCGHCFEALLEDYNGNQSWIPVRIEHQRAYYYLVGYPGAVLEGLMIRENR